MATVICMDGLGGHPEFTFSELKSFLETNQHDVVYAKVDGINSHDDRIRNFIEAFNKEESYGKEIYLLGQSAGGGAARCAANILAQKNKRVAGVILLSPSMPHFTLFMTKPLLKCIIGHLFTLLFGKQIHSTTEQYKSIVEPLAPELKAAAMLSLVPLEVSCRKGILAFLSRAF